MKIDGSLSKFYQYAFPMSTVLVTCVDKNDKPNCITVSWHTPLSKKPPLHGISIAPQRYSHHLISEGKEFCINFLRISQVMQAHFCGTHSGRSLEKHTQTPITYIPAKNIRAPLIQEAYAHFECLLRDSIPVGDHTFFIGEVVNVIADKGAFSNDLLDTEKISPLYYRGGNSYIGLDSQTLTQY